MTESTEQLHERVEEMKNEVWEMTRLREGYTRTRALYAYTALEELADELHKQIQAEAATQRYFKIEDQPNG